ncbi:MAG: amylosucrase [Actinomycetota bacterium]|jgi:amylosucrase|nr:amylosucrase [Actinomycetota bacterium]
MSPLPSDRVRRAHARDTVQALLPSVQSRVAQSLGELEAEALVARIRQHLFDMVEPLQLLYGRTTDVAALTGRLLDLVVDAALERPPGLRRIDRRREVDPRWFQRSRVIGYVCYAGRFAGTLDGVRHKLDYLAELGVTYLHVMPLLKPREGANDGGYAVADYRQVDPRLGTMADLEALAADLHDRDMSLCVDLVLNHTAAEHPWALAARAGDPTYRRFYRVFPDRTAPDRYERTMPEVFPDTSPGSFTHVEGLGWVWTTFESFQWDLDWTNPDVFAAMLDTMLFVANRGVDVLRLDAAPFLWKREGTDGQNQPEVHLILQALRALVAVAAPGVVFKAEAIVSPDQLVTYLGAHEGFRPECDIAYNNQLMVMLWSSLASRDSRLATASLRRMREIPPGTAWVTYLRCHDDIGWAVSDEDAHRVGLDPAAHRSFLSDYFSGVHPGSFARGRVFQHNPRTGDRRISGTAAALCGLDAARETGDDEAVDIAVRRLVMLYSVVYSYGGIPLLYMGDELGLPNDPHWADDPEHVGDNRWMHRPPMDWAAAARRHDPATVEGRLFASLQSLARARAGLLALRAGTGTTLLDTASRHVLALRRRHPRGPAFVGLANFSDGPSEVGEDVLLPQFTARPELRLSSDGVRLTGPGVRLPAWGWAWLADH